MITVYYDDLCGMCSKEINFYKKISNKDTFQWLPLSSSTKDLKNDNLKQSEALLFLHAKDDKENFYLGVDAFLLIWSRLPVFKYLRFLFKLPIVYPIAKFLYNKFAYYRFNKLSHCKLAFDTDNKKGK